MPSGLTLVPVATSFRSVQVVSLTSLSQSLSFRTSHSTVCPIRGRPILNIVLQRSSYRAQMELRHAWQPEFRRQFDKN